MQRTTAQRRLRLLPLGAGLALAVLAPLLAVPAAAVASDYPLSTATDVWVSTYPDTVELPESEPPQSISFDVSAVGDASGVRGDYEFTVTTTSGVPLVDRTGTFGDEGDATETWTPNVAAGAYTAAVRTRNAYSGVVVAGGTTITVKRQEPRVTSVSVATSTGTIVPSRGGPADTALFTLRAFTASGAVAHGSASLTIAPANDPAAAVKTWGTDTSGTHTVTWDGLVDGAAVAAGTYSATWSFTDSYGNTESDSTPIEVAPDGALLQASARVLFPAKDGFRDLVTLTGSDATATGDALPGDGSIQVTDPTGAVVWARAVTSSAPASFDWDGRVDGQVRPGDYTATYRFTSAGQAPATRSLQLSVRSTTAVKAVLRRSFGTVYPVKDRYRDVVSLRFWSTTTTGHATSGTGSLTIRNARGHAVKTWHVTSSRTRLVTWSGRFKGRVVPGGYTVTYRFRGAEGAVLMERTSLRVSAKRLVTVYREKHLTAWGLFQRCANLNRTYEPCSRGDLWGHGDGARVYSAGDDTPMLVGSSASIGGIPVKWRLTFHRAVVGAGDPRFYYDATGAARADSSTWHAKLRFPHSTDSGGRTVTTPWSHRSDHGRARFVLHSSDWGSLYLRYITLQAYTRVLR